VYVNQSEEDSAFWRMFGLEGRPQRDYDIIGEWNAIFIDVSFSRGLVLIL
jgi:hypothetical protein